ncbi:succinate dehydrogenase cytochrome b556 subunit [Candidatus Williamhamiltonella defendens]|uniref:succinate dehydrogenase cytochrome b556 subunit n=1 Tax=Candidatus Williamhamiltonella defendens TaxID=138072 RepID=UPI00387E7E88
MWITKLINDKNGVKMTKKQRPINLDLMTFRFPLTAIASILHRISGVIIFFAVGFFVWLLGLSLSSPEGFIETSTIVDHFLMKLILWGFLTALFYHLVGGIRHLLMDFSYIEETLKLGIRSAQVVMVITVLLSILVGIIIW